VFEPNALANHDLAVSLDGRFIAVATFQADVKLWEMKHSREGDFKGGSVVPMACRAHFLYGARCSHMDGDPHAQWLATSGPRKEHVRQTAACSRVVCLVYAEPDTPRVGTCACVAGSAAGLSKVMTLSGHKSKVSSMALPHTRTRARTSAYTGTRTWIAGMRACAAPHELSCGHPAFERVLGCAPGPPTPMMGVTIRRSEASVSYHLTY
jgi:hypothetical protein